jgi:hypothetical protein
VIAPNEGKTSGNTERRTIGLNEARTVGSNEGRMAMTLATSTVARHLREAAETSVAPLRTRTA